MAPVSTFVFLRWPEGTSAEYAPAVVRQALVLPQTWMNTVYAILPSGMLRDFEAATLRSGSMAIGLAVVPDLDRAVEAELEQAFAEGALLCRYDNERPPRARSSVAWTLAHEIAFPPDQRVTLGDLQDSGAVALLEAILACVEQLWDSCDSGRAARQVRRDLNGVHDEVVQALRAA